MDVRGNQAGTSSAVRTERATFGIPSAATFPRARTEGDNVTSLNAHQVGGRAMSQDEAPAVDPLRLAPIPLASGQVFTGADGTARTVTQVYVVIATEDGQEERVALTAQHGGWWAPQR